MNDYLGNLVARSRNAAEALRPKFAHPYESLGEPSGPVAAPFPEEFVPGLTAAAGPDEAPGAAPSGRAARAGESAPPVHTEAAGDRSPAGQARPETTSQTTSHAPLPPSDPAAVRPLSSEDSTPGELSRPLPAADAPRARRVSRRGEQAAPRGVGDATERGPARESYSPAQGNELRQGRAPGTYATPYAAPPDARQTGGLEAPSSGNESNASRAAHVLRAEASLVTPEASLFPSSPDSPADERRPRSAEPDASARQDARAPLTPGMFWPAAPDLTRDAEPEPPAPTIRVTIGRVEVRAVTPTPAPNRRPSRPAPRMSLDEYLRSQNGGRG